jgi:DNA (cytosine-5)-methyltransferase 1
VEILKEKKPKYFLLENVKHLVKHNHGKTWQIIQKEIKDLGYITTQKPLILNPTSFGIPQDRARVYITGIRKDLIEHDYLDIQKPSYLIDTLNGKRTYKSRQKQNSILRNNCNKLIEREREREQIHTQSPRTFTNSQCFKGMRPISYPS